MREPSGGNGWDAGGRIHWAEDPAPLSGSQPNYLPMPAMPRFFTFDRLQPPVCRLGLATRGNTRLTGDDVLVALERGLNYWNWCGHQDGMADAIRQLGPRRKQVLIAAQLWARDAQGVQSELQQVLDRLRIDTLDVATHYYVERPEEWRQIAGPEGALQGLRKAQDRGRVGMIGLTTHQRELAVRILRERRLDLLMIRYNAAHRGAEDRIFPEAGDLQMPLVAFTALRWCDLLKPTPADPADFAPPPVRDWYRFVLAHPAVSIALAAPGNRSELLHTLGLLDDWRPPTPAELQAMRAHGDRVHRHARAFV